MRKKILSTAFVAAIAFVTALLTGCSKGHDPVVEVTPELEAAQKEAVQAANQDEAAHRKNGRQASKPLSGSEMEALRGKQKK